MLDCDKDETNDFSHKWHFKYKQLWYNWLIFFWQLASRAMAYKCLRFCVFFFNILFFVSSFIDIKNWHNVFGKHLIFQILIFVSIICALKLHLRYVEHWVLFPIPIPFPTWGTKATRRNPAPSHSIRTLKLHLPLIYQYLSPLISFPRILNYTYFFTTIFYVL